MRGTKAKQLYRAALHYVQRFPENGTVRQVYKAMKKHYKENKRRGTT